MAITLPHSAITEIPNTEPAATPALWNTRYNEIDGNFERLATYTPVGTSSTAAGTKAKAVTINGFSLSTNAFVLVKFSNANTASAPTLNVSNTGAKAIYFNGAAVPTGYLEANKFYHFVYDGSHWVLTGDVDVRHLYLPLAGGTITGNLAVRGTTTLTGLLTANGGVTTKKVTATELDLNGKGDVSGNLIVGGFLQGTGNVSVTGTIHVRNARPFAVTIPQISDITQPPSSEVQAWPVNVYDAQAHAIAMLKYIKKSNGESQWVLADIDYSDGDQHWAQLTIGHKADGTAYLRSDVPAEFGGGLGVSGGLFTVSGSGEVSGNWKVEGNVETTVLKGSMLQIEGSSGTHIVRQVKNYTKGQAPSNPMYIGHFLYGSGVTNQTSNRVAGNEIAISSSSGNVTYTFSCYEPVAGSTKTTTLRLGYGDESWINLNADNVNLASTVNVNGALNVNNNDVSVKGWIRLTGNVESSGTQPFKLTAGALDVKAAPTSNIQLWPLGVYDKNGLAVAYIKYNKYTDGRQNIQLLSRYVREDDTYELTGLSVGHRADGTFYTDVPHPVTESNDNSIATTAWSVGKTGNRGNLSGFETPVVQSSALTVTNTSRDTNLVTGAVKITVNDGAANQAWTKTVAISNGSATIALGSKWKWYGGAAPDVSANCVLVLHWCSTFGVASLIVTA